MFFLPSLGGGGAEMNAVRLAPGLLQNGYAPIYVTTRGPGGYEDFLPGGARTIVLPTGRIASSTLRMGRSVTPLARLIDECRPDIMCPVMPPASLVCLLARRRARHKPPVVLSIQNEIRLQTMEARRLYARGERWLARRLWGGLDHVIALSEGVAGEVRTYFPGLADRLSVVPNAGPPAREDPVDAAAATGDFAIPRGAPVFLACGRLTEQKGYPWLIDAFAKLDPASGAHLLILGVGPLEEALKTRARRLGVADRITFCGFQRDPLAFMARADVFVLSSLWEGFGNVIVEAMSVGTPVISTRCPHGPDEIITDGENGLLVPPADSAALAGAMERLLADRDLRVRLGEGGRRRATDFDPDRIAGAYAAIFGRYTAPR